MDRNPANILRMGIVLLVLTGCAGVALCADEGEEYFESTIRPILVQHCQRCHGEAKQKSGLRLDNRNSALKGGDGGAIIVPGHPEKSRLIEAVGWRNEDLQMPPKQKLAPREIAALAEWVRRGAPWGHEAGPKVNLGPSFDLEQRRKEHWAWQPIRPQRVPQVKEQVWCKGDIDRFVVARLESKGIQPAPRTDRRTLIRRVYFDLTGLPPRPDEVEAFVSDASPDAYEKVVDRLLASGHFGERWGRHWLDLVRYAETRGHEFDPLIPYAWEYRDYVIRAINADVPYDQFIREQLAGDLLPHPRINEKGWNESVLGTGFYFLGEAVHSPVDIRQDETDRLDNIVDTMGKAFLGLTVGCARCHDHKFDAIAQKDYYSLEGFLISSSYRQVRFETHKAEQRIAGELAALRSERTPTLISAISKAVRPALGARRLAEVYAGSPVFPAANLQDSAGRILIDYGKLDEGGWRANGYAFGTGPIQPGQAVLGESPWQPIAEVATFAMAHRDPGFNRIASVGGERDYGTLGAWDRAGRTVKTPKVTLESGRLWYLVRGSGRAYAAVDSHLLVAGPLHGQLLMEWKGDPNRWRWIGHNLSPYKGHRVEVEFSPVGDAPLDIAQVVEADARPGEPLEKSPLDLKSFVPLLTRALDAMEEGRVGADLAPAANWACVHVNQLADEQALKTLAGIASPILARRAELVGQIPAKSRTAPAMWDGNGVDEYVLRRGQYKTPGDPAPRRLLQAIAGESQGSFGPGSGRLKLAELILAEDDPFPARVMVNRVWQHLFGTGIVATVDNFGVLGARPSDPELLDYLADTFRRDGWSLKRLIRRIVLSSTYLMSSTGDPASEQADPQNLLVHRMNIKRLEGEAIRDAILAVSGRLDEGMYGESVEGHLTSFMDGRGRPASGPLDGAGRRSIYIRTRRNFLSPMMLAFDVPIPFQCMGRRSVSNVPAQALFLMNDPFVVEQANLWGRHIAGSGGSDADKIKRMYDQAFSRAPTAAELAQSQQFLRDASAAYGKADERAWGELAHVLLNVKEFIFIR